MCRSCSRRNGCVASPLLWRAGLTGVLAQDPRPAYQHDPARVYGFAYARMESAPSPGMAACHRVRRRAGFRDTLSTMRQEAVFLRKSPSCTSKSFWVLFC
jgi:hypothetical protein